MSGFLFDLSDAVWESARRQREYDLAHICHVVLCRAPIDDEVKPCEGGCKKLVCPDHRNADGLCETCAKELA